MIRVSTATVFIISSLLPLFSLAGCADNGSTAVADGMHQYRYAALTSLTAPDDSRTSYLHLLDSIEPGDTLTTDRAVEWPGAVSVFPGIPGEREFFAVGGEAPTVKRWGVTDAGKLRLLGEFSVAGKGVPTLYGQRTLAFSATEAVMLEYAHGERFITFNPTTMEMGEDIPLPGVSLEGYALWPSADPIQVPGLGLTFTGYYWGDEGIVPTVPAKTTIIVYDPTTRVADAFSDDRCSAQVPVVHGGYLYLMSNSYSQMRYVDPLLSSRSCVIRFDVEKREFDVEYFVDLDEAVGKPAVGMAAIGDGRAYVKFLDESRLPANLVERDPWPVLSGPYWHVGIMDLSTGEVESLEGNGLFASWSSTFWFEGRMYLFSENEDLSRKSWVDITDRQWFEFLPPSVHVPFGGNIVALE